MTTPKDDSGPFHPAQITDNQWIDGASFREVAAMHAMAAWFGNPDCSGSWEQGAKWAVEAADALIAQLKK